VSSPLLDLIGIGKVFPGVVALDQVSLSVRPGEIRALMGENGAGKSTLLKVLAGEHRPDAGEVRVGGESRTFQGPRDSAAAGVAIIHQELQLAPELTVAENLMLGAFPTRGPFLARGAMRARAQAVLARLGEAIDPDAKVKALPIGKRQMVEIGKALLRDARVIAFDEPTSSLSARETQTLMGIIRELKAEGRAILYVSHRMEEVFALCDSVTILRDGRLVSTHPDMEAASPDTLIAEMVGRSIEDAYAWRPRTLGDVTLTLEALVGPGVRSPVSLQVRRGEILGFFGLVGAGRSELFKLIYGAVRPSGGALRLDGAALRLEHPRRAIAAGFALAPEDRKDEGIVPLASVRDNIVLAERNRSGGPFLDRGGERRRGAELIAQMRVKTASPEAPINTLSGGNQQKAILARWLATDAQVLLLDEPTRGIDIGSRSEIYALMYALAERGKTLLVASSDMPEVLGVSDRIVVMREGAVSGVLDRQEAGPETLLRLALPDAAERNSRTA
jgi:L-arabinose transport system ATP-binding protein